MDINNYNYINYSDKHCILSEYDNGEIWIYFEYCVNWFGERFYTVDSILGEISETFKTREEGARFWNSLVDEEHYIPLF